MFCRKTVLHTLVNIYFYRTANLPMINYLNLDSKIRFLTKKEREKRKSKSLVGELCQYFRPTLYTLTFDIELMSRYQWRFPFLQLLFLTSYVSLR